MAPQIVMGFVGQRRLHGCYQPGCAGCKACDAPGIPSGSTSYSDDGSQVKTEQHNCNNDKENKQRG